MFHSLKLNYWDYFCEFLGRFQSDDNNHVSSDNSKNKRDNKANKSEDGYGSICKFCLSFKLNSNQIIRLG